MGSSYCTSSFREELSGLLSHICEQLLGDGTGPPCGLQMKRLHGRLLGLHELDLDVKVEAEFAPRGDPGRHCC